MSGYGSSTVKRQRRNSAQLDALDAAIVQVVTEDAPLTLRGVYYRVLSLGAVEKSENDYRAIGRELLKLRRTGVIPYTSITDGTRWIMKPTSWDSLGEMLDDAAASYRRALWHDQPAHVEVYAEKDAIAGILHDVTARWDVPLGVLRGYASESFTWNVAEAIKAQGKAAYVYHFGDHDPSGVNQFEVFAERVRGFAPDADITFVRAAVTPEQIEQWALPTRPTKQSDTRARNFTGESVEIDAVRSPVLRDLVERSITQHIDPYRLAAIREVEASERDLLVQMRPWAVGA
ncbi:conserved hypothetical protein [Frankia sp. Hr75.2]|nr:conserved hypothetical protein [Frankia sp. Hr75.2]